MRHEKQFSTLLLASVLTLFYATKFIPIWPTQGGSRVKDNSSHLTTFVICSSKEPKGSFFLFCFVSIIMLTLAGNV